MPQTESTTWTIANVELRAYGVPDSTKAYSIRLKAKTSAPLVSLTQDGLLLGVNTTVEPEAEAPLPKSVPAPAPLNPRDYMTQTILAAGSTAKMAQLTAEEIYDIRDSRNALVRGEADNTPKDGVQLKLMLDNLYTQLAALESMFKGRTLTSREVQTITYDPTPADLQAERVMVARFSRRLGLVDTDDLSGEPVWMSMKLMGNLPAAESNVDADRKKAKMEQGLRVNQPARVQLTLFTAERQLLATEVAMPQMGTVEILSDALFNKKMDTQVVMHQHAGSVREVRAAAPAE